MKHDRLVLLSAIVALAGCAGPTPAERAARAEADVQELMQVYGSACEQLGYKRGDDKWRDCMLRISLRDEIRYNSRPLTTTCFGRRGYLDCTTM